MTDYRGGGMTNMKIRQVEKDLTKMRAEIEEKKKEIEGKVKNCIDAVFFRMYRTFARFSGRRLQKFIGHFGLI